MRSIRRGTSRWLENAVGAQAPRSWLSSVASRRVSSPTPQPRGGAHFNAGVAPGAQSGLAFRGAAAAAAAAAAAVTALTWHQFRAGSSSGAPLGGPATPASIDAPLVHAVASLLLPAPFGSPSAAASVGDLPHAAAAGGAIAAKSAPRMPSLHIASPAEPQSSSVSDSTSRSSDAGAAQVQPEREQPMLPQPVEPRNGQGAQPATGGSLQPGAADAGSGHAGETEGWWAWLKASVTGAPPPQPPVAVPLPTDKLACHLLPDRQGDGALRPPVVLLNCGSFNPPTIAHLRMFEVAADALREAGFDVLGCYISPVNDAYGKPDLAPAVHRVRMAELAAATSPSIMVDGWEAAQPGWQRTLAVMRRVSTELGQAFSTDAADFPNSHAATPVTATQAATAAPSPHQHKPETSADAAAHKVAPPTAAPLPPIRAPSQPSSEVWPAPVADRQREAGSGGRPRVMLLCGADLVESFVTPGVWRQEHLAQILGPDHGVVCIARRGSDVQRLLAPSDGTSSSGNGSSSMLGPLARNIWVVEDPVALDVSSSKLREQLQKEKSARYLTPDAVLSYIKTHRLYMGSGTDGDT